MNIAYIIEIFLPSINGIVITTLDLARRMKKRGHKVVFIVPQSEHTPAVLEGMPVFGIPSVEFPIYPNLRFILPGSRIPEAILQRENIDIVHVTGPSTVAFASMRAASRLGIRVVHTWHTMLLAPEYIKHFAKLSVLIPSVTALARRLFWYFLKNVALLTPTESTKKLLEREYKNISVTVISNGLNTAKFSIPATEKHEGLPEDPYFLYVGRISTEKSIEIVIRAFVILLDRYPDQRLVIVGDGPSYKEIDAYIRELGISRQVVMLGTISNDKLAPIGLYSRAKAFVSASKTEVQGLTFIESICSGTPIVAVDVPVLRGEFKDAGILVPPDDSRAFAGAMQRMIEDQVLYRQLTEACVLVKKKYDGEKSCDQTLAFYEDVLGAKKSGSDGI